MGFQQAQRSLQKGGEGEKLPLLAGRAVA